MVLLSSSTITVAEFIVAAPLLLPSSHHQVMTDLQLAHTVNMVTDDTKYAANAKCGHNGIEVYVEKGYMRRGVQPGSENKHFGS